MNYFYTHHPTQAAARALGASLRRELSNGKSVVWLLSGGSSIAIAIRAARGLSDLDLRRLSVSLTDERYGNVGHEHENWQLLLDAGLNLPGANLYRPLNGTSRRDTTADFNNWLEAELAKADYKIAIFGMGTDGHTAGIKPGSPAATSPDFAADFTGEDFERITMTPRAIAQCDEAIIQISGSEKAAQLDDLLNRDLPLTAQPAQILKTIPHATIFSDIAR